MDQVKLQQELQHNLLQLRKGLQVLEMPHQFKQEQEEWHVQHQNQMELSILAITSQECQIFMASYLIREKITLSQFLQERVKEKIQAKIKDLAARGYHVKNDIIFEQDTTVKNYNCVVTFTKEATGTSGFRMAPAVQPRASRNRRSLEQPAPQKVKVNVFYNFDQMKDIAGFLGDINGTPLEVTEGSTNEQVKEAVKSQVDAKKEELSKRGYTFKEDYVYQANGKDYNYVVTFSKAAK